MGPLSNVHTFPHGKGRLLSVLRPIDPISSSFIVAVLPAYSKLATREVCDFEPALCGDMPSKSVGMFNSALGRDRFHLGPLGNPFSR
jgi:hypothetical protein